MKASDFDARFDAGDDVTGALDMELARRPGLEAKRVDLNFPTWMLHSLDKEAHRLGVTREALIKLWLADKLQHRQNP